MPPKIPVSNFWTDPKDPEVTATSIDFGYDSQDGRKWRYRAQEKAGDRKSFQEFLWALLDSRKRQALPWPDLGPLKNKVKLINLDDGAEQLELPLRVARRFLQQ